MGLLLISALGQPAPTFAECLPVAPIPPATEAASTAREIFVGTVIENVRFQLYDFRVRIDHVFRGSARVGDIRRLEMVKAGWPLIELPDGTKVPPCPAIPASEGNVVAFALKAIAPDGKTVYNAASWISGAPLFYEDPLPTTTLGEIAALAMPATDTAPPNLDRSGGKSPGIGLLGSLTVLLAALLVLRRSRDIDQH